MNRTIPVLCCSVAANPSPLGVKLHNAGYEALGLDYRYVAIGAANIEPILQSMRTLPFRGLGVSMPHKQTVIRFLDEISPDVQAIGACNTVVQEDERLHGYNTDWIGALGAIDEAGATNLRSAVIIGAGGVARAIAYALKQRGMAVFVSARSVHEREQLVNDLRLDGESSLELQGRFDAELVVNATPISDSVSLPTDLDAHKYGKALFDVVFQRRQTTLIAEAERRKWITIPGWRMLLHQAMEQFRLYTGQDAPVAEMGKVLEDALPD